MISKEYVKNTVLPTVIKNEVEVEGAKPIPIEGSDYKAKFASSAGDEIVTQYSGSSDITTNMQKYNKDYFNDYTSTNANMKAVAYMLDTVTWSKFATSNKGYAEYAFGGPSIELLFTAYNKYTEGTANPTVYETDAVSTRGYQVRKTSNDGFANFIINAIANDVTTSTNQIDSPYSVSSLSSQALGYWLASPSHTNTLCLVSVNSSGDVSASNYANDYNGGFRPVVLLKSNIQLEKTKDSNGNDAFKIVEQ